MKKYLEDINRKIDKLMELEATPERVSAMHDLLYVKKHLMKHDEAMMDNPDIDNPRKSYFGGM